MIGNNMNYLDREIMTAKEIMGKLRFSSRSAFDAFCADETVNFPKPIKTGIRRKGWFADEFSDWMKTQSESRE